MGFMSKEEPRILVVDDDKELADNLVEYLNELGYQASPAYGGREGLTRFEQEDFKLVITDLVMPEMDGMELLEAVKARDSRAVVMVITGYGTIESAVKAIKSGAYDFIPKPFKMEELEVIVNRALERYTIFRQLRVFRGLFFFLLMCIPLLLLIGIILAMVWK